MIYSWFMSNGMKLGGLLAIVAAVWLHGCNFGEDRQQAITDKLRVEFNTFVSKTDAIGKEAAAKAKATEAADKLKKEKADDENLRTISELRDSIDRMRSARARGSYLPEAAADSPSPESITFDRAELERAIRHLDGRVQDLIAQGDEARINLDTAIRWGAQWAADDKDTGAGLKSPK